MCTCKLNEQMKSRSIRRLRQQHIKRIKSVANELHSFRPSTPNMASNARRLGNTDLVPPKLRRQARVIFYPLECDQCQKRGPEVNQCYFTANSRILCRTCITSLAPCVRCGKDGRCGLTPIVAGFWWRYVFTIGTWMVLTCLGHATLRATNHCQDPVRLAEASLHRLNSLMNSVTAPDRLQICRKDSCRRMVMGGGGRFGGCNTSSSCKTLRAIHC